MIIPIECIHHIFSYVTEFRDILSMRLVNKTFHELIMLSSKIRKIEIRRNTIKLIHLFRNIKEVELYVSSRYIYEYYHYMTAVTNIYNDWFKLDVDKLTIICGKHPPFIRELSNMFHSNYDKSLHLILFSTPSVKYPFFYIEMKGDMMIVDKDSGEIYDLRINHEIKILISDYISYKIHVPISYFYLDYSNCDRKIKSNGEVFICTRHPEQIPMDDSFWTRKNRLDTFYEKIPYLLEVEERIRYYINI